jgi:IMP dehydrogenase
MIDKAFCFDDVLLVPTYTSLKSRSDPITKTTVGKIKLDIPLISSPMDTVTDANMIIKMSELGGLGILHRFYSDFEYEKDLKELREKKIFSQHKDYRDKRFKFSVSVGADEKSLNDLERYYDYIDSITIDLANGHSDVIVGQIKRVRELMPNVNLIAGNVATGEGFKFLSDLGVDAVRVGIGGGSICKTRIMTGFGLPTLYSVIDCYNVKTKYNLSTSIIADGGIRYPSDLVKSIVGGADAVMCGGIFAQTFESAGKVFYNNDDHTHYKYYRGMASEEVQNELRGGLKKGTCAEGVQHKIKVDRNLEDVFNDFIGGLRSAMTYCNAMTIEDLRRNAKFKSVTYSSLSESHAYGTRR